MKRQFKNASSTVWTLLAIPLIALAYPVATIIVPAVIRCVVPESVRAVLSML